MAKKIPPLENIQMFYFWKDQCAPCKAARPIVERLAAEHRWPVTYLDVRSEEGEPYIIPFNLLSVPTLAVTIGGKIALTLSGPELQAADKLQKRVQKVLEGV